MAGNLHYVARSGFSFRVEVVEGIHQISFVVEGREFTLPPGEVIDIGEAMLSLARVCGHLDKMKKRGLLPAQRNLVGKTASSPSG